MYEHNEDQLIMSGEFFQSFGDQLNPDSCWDVMSLLIHWAEAETKYIKRLGNLLQTNCYKSEVPKLGGPFRDERINKAQNEFA